MQPSFAKRKAKRIGRDHGDRLDNTEEEGNEPPAVVRPSIGSRHGSSKVKKPSVLRTSFADEEASASDGEAPSRHSSNKHSLSRTALESSAARKVVQHRIAADRFPTHSEGDQPSYSADILSELKASTPSRPADDLSQAETETSEAERKDLDLASKFGTNLAIENSSAIPSAAEIKEKKERRARLAKEEEFISLDTDGEGGGEDSDTDSSSDHETSILPYSGPKRPKDGPSRTMQDEDDIGEGFDEFVSDGRIALGKRAERQQRQEQKDAMKTMIQDAQASDSASENDSDIERRNAYEVAQTRAGMDGLKEKPGEGEVKPTRPRTPPRITPIPTLSGVLEKLKAKKEAKELESKVTAKRLEGVRAELRDIEVRKVELQRLMEEAGERFEKLQAQVVAEQQKGENGADRMVVEKAEPATTAERGLESLGSL